MENEPSPFQVLHNVYSSVIAEMNEEFTSHEFIQHLFREHQREFIEALYEYRNHQAPVRQLTSQISRQLHNDTSINYLKQLAPNSNIFGEQSECASWRKK